MNFAECTLAALEAFHHTIRDNTNLEWMDQAECRGAHSNLFFPERGESVVEAKRVCHECPVREECLEFALKGNEHFGIWGGTSPHEREGMRHDRRLPSRPRKPIEHGTEAGYSAHRRRDVPLCEPCKQAHREAHSLYQRRRNNRDNDLSGVV